MKKYKSVRSPTVGQQTVHLAKKIATLSFDDSFNGSKEAAVAQRDALKALEVELMGDEVTGSSSLRTDAKARNLEQMVSVLHGKLKSLSANSKMRMELCKEDLNEKSDNCSEKFHRNATEAEDGNMVTKAKTTGEVSSSFGNNRAARENLVSSENIYVDPTRLVLRTKAPTETGKKLETLLDNTYGNKSKILTRADKTKFKFRQRFEGRKHIRQRLERELHLNIDNYIMRCSDDPELNFSAPSSEEEAVRWPITVKAAAVPRHRPVVEIVAATAAANSGADTITANTTANKKNASAESTAPIIQTSPDGEMDLDLLLQYSLEKICLPNGEHFFFWLIRQDVIPRYFLFLFWIVKIKFFQSDSTTYDETFLLRLASKEYIKLLELLQGHTEYEKDFAFKYLPYIISNAIYYAFYFLCPGSRHSFTLAFRKTVLLQVVRIIHGVQLSSLSIKVLWAKLFPEDQEGEENSSADPRRDEDPSVENGAFPVSLAFSKSTKKDALRGSATVSPKGVKSPKGGLLVSLDTDNTSTGARYPPFSPVKKNTRVGSCPPLSPGSLNRLSSPADSRARSQFSAKTNDPRTRALNDQLPYERIALNRPPNKSPHIKTAVLHQRSELVDAKEVSPMLQQYLNMSNSRALVGQQLMARVTPISWSLYGGSDTHRWKHSSNEVCDDLSMRAEKLQREYNGNANKWRSGQKDIILQVERSREKLLSSGPQALARFTLDLMREQRNRRANGAAAGGTVGGLLVGGDAKLGVGAGVLASAPRQDYADELGLGMSLGIVSPSSQHHSSTIATATYNDDDIEEFLKEIS